jgi:aryl-alcohol dehydrogenase-like predicted oxidoreductase
MRMRRLGSDGPDLSVVGFGAWEAGGTAWGANASDDAVIAAIRAGLDAGMTWVDTAEVYGDGVSERLVGRAVAGRDGVLVASKVAPAPEGTGFRPEQVRRACEASIGRLGVDAIDLYQLHWPDDGDTPVEETWGAMVDLVEAGLARWIGVSNFDRELIARCETVRHVDSLQPRFNLLMRDEGELIRWCGAHGIGVVAYAPLAYGLLTGAITADTAYPDGDWRTSSSDEDPDDPDVVPEFLPDRLPGVLARIERLRPIAERRGISLAQLALAWCHHQPGVTSAIAGSRSPDHARANADAGSVELDATTLAEVEAAIAGPAG